jgi:glutamyl-Q tRNA(Asp) synthetase
MQEYMGRFAPSPTGALHAGSLLAALASWLDARAHGGKWLVRIEDIDSPRCVPGADAEILRQLAACGLISDDAPVYQSQRQSLYQAALDRLIANQAAYPCTCSRKDIEAAWANNGLIKPRHGELIYPGTCRHGFAGREPRAWRFDTQIFKPNQRPGHIDTAQSAMKSVAPQISTQIPYGITVRWLDRRKGEQQQSVTQEVGDFVLRRADGLWAYQLAVVVDDAAQGVTHVVRGEDLTDNTARQILLQDALGFPSPAYLHTPLVLAADGEKLSKQHGAQPVSLANEAEILSALNIAAHALDLSVSELPVKDALSAWQKQWRERWCAAS